MDNYTIEVNIPTLAAQDAAKDGAPALLL